MCGSLLPALWTNSYCLSARKALVKGTEILFIITKELSKCFLVVPGAEMSTLLCGLFQGSKQASTHLGDGSNGRSEKMIPFKSSSVNQRA